MPHKRHPSNKRTIYSVEKISFSTANLRQNGVSIVRQKISQKTVGTF